MLTAEEEALLAGASAFSSENEKLAAYATIQQEIDKYEEIIRAAEAKVRSWKSRYNSLTNISRLPSDIFVEIFAFVVNSSTIERIPPPTATSYSTHEPNFRELFFNAPTWVTMSHVCTQWRRIMLDSPCLWSRPYFGRSLGSREMLSRARDIPISADATFFNHHLSPEDEEQEELVFQNLHRIVELNIREPKYPLLSGSGRDPVIANYLQRPAPLLRHLLLISPDPYPENCLPHNLFSGEYPKLETLALNNWTLPLEESYLKPLSNLTGLYLHRFSQHQLSLRFTPSQFVSALRHLHNLKELVFRHSLFNPNYQDRTHLEACGNVVLPRLQMVYSEESVGASLSVFGHISMPSLRYIGCTFTFVPTSYNSRDTMEASEGPLGDFIHLTVGKFQENLDPPIFLKITRAQSDGYALTFRNVLQCQSTPNSDFFPTPQMDVYALGSDGFDMLSSICLLTCIDDLEIISAYVPISRNAWMGLSSARSLRRLMIEGEASFCDLIDILLNPSPPSDSLEGLGDAIHSEQTPFPCLEVIGVYHASFSEYNGIHTGQLQFPSQQVIECIKTRRQRNLGPREILLRFCTNVPVEQITAFNADLDVNIIVEE